MSTSVTRRSTLVAALTLTACSDPLAPLGTTAATALAAAPGAAPAADPGMIAGRWVVQLRTRGDADRLLATHVAATRRSGARHLAAGRLHVIVASLSAEEARAMAADEEVESVEPDREIRGTGVQLDAPWGLDRIDQAERPLAGTYVYPRPGAAVTVYMLDTGIRLSHQDFEGRAVAGADFTSGARSGTDVDCDGHGTHDAAVVGGRRYGVAKAVTLVSVRVLDCGMRGTVSQAIAGLGWVVEQKRRQPTMAAVVNLSLEATAGSVAFDQAVSEALRAGITVVAAAGNASTDACRNSPARVAGVITVGASDASDRFASFSNRGPCVALAAPGSAIVSAWAADDSASQSMSGTSSAAPLVAGAAALYLAAHPAATPAEVRAALVGNATHDALASVPAGTANLLLGTSFLLGRTPPACPPGPGEPGGLGEPTPLGEPSGLSGPIGLPVEREWSAGGASSRRAAGRRAAWPAG